MPSGAKKRKAAKKKKEQETNNSTNNNPQGENELKSIDEKGSDGGEVDSPAHRDHDEDHQFNEVSQVVEVSEPCDHDEDHQFNEVSQMVEVSELSAVVSKSLEEVPNDRKIDEEAEGGKGSVSVIEWDVKSEESCENKDVSVSAVIIESDKESNYRNGKSEGSNNETVTAKNSKDEPDNSVKETVDVDDLINSVKETVNSVAGSSAESAKESNYGNGKSDGSNIETVTVNNLKDEPDNSVKETVAVDDLVNSVKEPVNSVVGSSSDLVKAVTSVPEVKSRDTGNVLQEKSVDSQVGPTNLTVKTNEDKVHPFSDEDVRKSSLEETKTKELDTEVSSSVSHHRIPESTNGVEHVKDSDTPECSENQPLVPSAPQIVRKTSWLSCCGLFEVLSGSNR